MANPMAIVTKRPAITATFPKNVGPDAEDAKLRLWLKPAPKNIPETKIALSRLPSAIRTNWRPGHPKPKVKHNAAKTMDKKFHRKSECATG